MGIEGVKVRGRRRGEERESSIRKAEIQKEKEVENVLEIGQN